MNDVLEFAGVMTVLLGTGYGGWFLYILIKRFEKRTAGATNRELAQVDARLERIEGAIETMAVEVERVAEAQRFATRLLAERSGVDGVALPAQGARLPEPR